MPDGSAELSDASQRDEAAGVGRGDSDAGERSRLATNIDTDGSGRIKFEEFRVMVREELKMGKAQVSETRLLSLWRAIDDNENGFISMTEFQRFMTPVKPRPLVWPETSTNWPSLKRSLGLSA